MSAAVRASQTCPVWIKISYLTNSSMMDVDFLPRHLVIIGGSYIGLEFAQMYRRFGAGVTIIEMGPRLIAHEDEDVSEAVKEILTDEGIVVRTNATCIGFKPHADGVAVDVDCTSGEPFAVGSHVLLAVGRRPNTDDLGLDRAGVAVKRHVTHHWSSPITGRRPASATAASL